MGKRFLVKMTDLLGIVLLLGSMRMFSVLIFAAIILNTVELLSADKDSTAGAAMTVTFSVTLEGRIGMIILFLDKRERLPAGRKMRLMLAGFRQ